jgi:hypothetical protein
MPDACRLGNRHLHGHQCKPTGTRQGPVAEVKNKQEVVFSACFAGYPMADRSVTVATGSGMLHEYRHQQRGGGGTCQHW